MSNFDLTKYKKGKLQQNSIPIMAGLESMKDKSIKLKNDSKSKTQSKPTTSNLPQSKSKPTTSNSIQSKSKPTTSNSIKLEHDNSPAIKDLEKVPKENWLKIPLRNNIRYIRADDNGRLHHGFLMRITPNRYQLELGSKSVDDFRCKKWVIDLNKVTDIYIKSATESSAQKAYIDKTSYMSQTSHDSTSRVESDDTDDADNMDNNNTSADYSEEINQLQDDIGQLKQELKRMSNEQKRILLLIQRLHSSEMI